MFRLKVQLYCIRCHAPIDFKPQFESIKCNSCNTEYEVILGIPDFRYEQKDWIFKDKRIARKLERLYFSKCFKELVGIRFSQNCDVPKKIFKYHFTHEMNYLKKGETRRYRITHLIGNEKYKHLSKQLCLDVGCGTGSSLVGLIDDFKFGFGVDVLMQDLILGKKYAEEHGISNIQYICAFAENLPFASNTFNLVNATDTIEHIENGQELFLKEIRRVLKRGGVFCFNSPNRFNLFTPEPHVQLWGLGFLPRRLMNPVCLKIRGTEYRGKRLLSYFELKKILKKTFNKDFYIAGVIIDPTQTKERYIGKLFSSIPWALKLFNIIFRYFLTNYQVIAYKPN